MKCLNLRISILSLLTGVLCPLFSAAAHYEIYGGVDAYATNMINVMPGQSPTDGVNLAQVIASNTVQDATIAAVSSVADSAVQQTNSVSSVQYQSSGTHTVQFGPYTWVFDPATGEVKLNAITGLGLNLSGSALTAPKDPVGGTGVGDWNWMKTEFVEHADTNAVIVEAVDAVVYQAGGNVGSLWAGLLSDADINDYKVAKLQGGQAAAAADIGQDRPMVTIPYHDDKGRFVDYSGTSGVGQWQSGWVDPDYLGGGWWFTRAHGLHYSDDEGLTWIDVDYFGTNLTSNSMLMRTSNGYIYWAPRNTIGIETAGMGLRRSVDNGASWGLVISITNTDENIWGFSEAPNGDLYAGLYTTSGHMNCKLYASRDNGTTWSEAFSDATENHVHNVKVDPYTGRVYILTGDTQKRVLYSDDRGNTWTDIVIAAGSLNQMLSLEFLPGLRIFGDDVRGAVYATTNDVDFTEVVAGGGAESWSNFDSWSYDGRIFHARLAHNDVLTVPEVIMTTNGYDWVVIDKGPERIIWRGYHQVSNVGTDGTAMTEDGQNGYLIDNSSFAYLHAAGTPGDNILTNSLLSSFNPDDLPQGGWDVGGGTGMSIVRTVAASSIYPDASFVNFAFSSTGTNQTYTFDSAAIPVTLGETFTFSVFLRGTSSDCIVSLALKEVNSSGSLVALNESEIPWIWPGEWRRYSRTFTTRAATVAAMKFQLQFSEIRLDGVADIDFALPQVVSGSNMTSFATLEIFPDAIESAFLVGEYYFDNENGGLFGDYSRAGNHATNTGGDITSGAVIFTNGNHAVFDSPNSTNFTISARIKSPLTGLDSSYIALFGEEVTGGFWPGAGLALSAPGGLLQVRHVSAAAAFDGTVVPSDYALTADTWYNVVYREKGNDISIWVDGLLIHEDTLTVDRVVKADASFGGALSTTWKGDTVSVDSYFVFNAALTSDQCLALSRGAPIGVPE